MNCIRTKQDDGGVHLAISGRLDALTVHELRATFDDVAAVRPRRVVIDFAELMLLDSSGVGAVVSLYKRVKTQNGTLVIVRAHGQPLLVLRSLELDRVFSAVGPRH